MNVAEIPLVRLIIPFVIGIGAAIIFPLDGRCYHWLLPLAVILVLSLLYISHKLQPVHASAWVGPALCVVGFTLTFYKTEKNAPSHFSAYVESSNQAYVRITDVSLKREKTIKTSARVLAVKRHNRWVPCSGNTIVYFPKKHSNIAYGDEMIICGKFSEITTLKNPGEFDYKTYLSYKNIYHQQFIEGDDSFKVLRNNSNTIVVVANDFKRKIQSMIGSLQLSSEEQAVANALLVGDESNVSEELMEAYSKAGVIHILSVSGFHVAIIYLAFNWLFSFFKRVKYGRVIQPVLLLLVIWFYALLTGLGPAILRASAMCSFFIVAQWYNKQVNIYNVVAASAFLVLMINPLLIMNIGFQLSYAAVVGIVAIHPKLFGLLQINNIVLKKMWMLVSVSIAAQLAVLPLCVYYFHQFPNYFIPANMIAVPVSSVIIYLGVLLLLLFKVSFIASYLSLCLKWSIVVLNKAIAFIAALPYSYTQDVFITFIQAVLMGLIIMALYNYWQHKKYNYLRAMLGFFVLFLFVSAITRYQELAQKKIIVYNVSKLSAIDFVNGQTSGLLLSDAAAFTLRRVNNHFKNCWSKLGVSNTRIIKPNEHSSALLVSGHYIRFYDKTLVLLNRHYKVNFQAARFHVKADYLVLSENCNVDILSVFKTYSPAVIIFDASNNYHTIARWKRSCLQYGIPYYSVPDSGAWVIDI